MRLGEVPGKVTNLEVWIVPGQEQSLDDLIERFKDQILQVDHDAGRILIRKEIHG